MEKGLGFEPKSPWIPPRCSTFELSFRFDRNFLCHLKENETESRATRGCIVSRCIGTLCVSEMKWLRVVF